MSVLVLAITTLVAYLIGAIPVGAVVAHFNRIDIVQHGSGKTGTTNVLRAVGRRAAALVLAGDLLKGSVAVLIAKLLTALLLPNQPALALGPVETSTGAAAVILAGAAAVIGHVWSIFLRITYGEWRGGRGVATAFGAALVVNPLITAAAVVFAVPTMLISRYVSLGSIVGAAAGALTLLLLVALGQMETPYLVFTLVSVFVIAAHRDNIQRLLNGTERKLGERVKA